MHDQMAECAMDDETKRIRRERKAARRTVN